MSTKRASISLNAYERGPDAKKHLRLDEIDICILTELQRDGRISKTALAEIVGLSTSSCLERMSRLEKRKIISGYHATLNLRAFSRIHTFMTEITLKT